MIRRIYIQIFWNNLLLIEYTQALFIIKKRPDSRHNLPEGQDPAIA